MVTKLFAFADTHIYSSARWSYSGYERPEIKLQGSEVFNPINRGRLKPECANMCVKMKGNQRECEQ